MRFMLFASSRQHLPEQHKPSKRSRPEPRATPCMHAYMWGGYPHKTQQRLRHTTSQVRNFLSHAASPMKQVMEPHTQPLLQEARQACKRLHLQASWVSAQGNKSAVGAMAGFCMPVAPPAARLPQTYPAHLLSCKPCECCYATRSLACDAPGDGTQAHRTHRSKHRRHTTAVHGHTRWQRGSCPPTNTGSCKGGMACKGQC